MIEGAAPTEQSVPNLTHQPTEFKAPSTVGWFDRWVYRCDICHYTCFSSHAIGRHLKETPGHTSKTVVSRPLHECLECGAKVPHNDSAIFRHLSDRHATTLSEYGIKHGLVSTDYEEDEERPWYDGCAYRCNTCRLVTKTKGRMTSHFKSFHKFADEGVTSGFETLRETVWECAICGRSAQCDRGSVAHHLGKHGSTLEDYEMR